MERQAHHPAALVQLLHFNILSQQIKLVTVMSPRIRMSPVAAHVVSAPRGSSVQSAGVSLLSLQA